MKHYLVIHSFQTATLSEIQHLHLNNTLKKQESRGWMYILDQFIVQK